MLQITLTATVNSTLSHWLHILITVHSILIVAWKIQHLEDSFMNAHIRSSLIKILCNVPVLNLFLVMVDTNLFLHVSKSDVGFI